MRIARTLVFAAVSALAAHAATAKVTLLVTTDLHGNLLPFDFYTGRPANRGLAKAASIIASVRKENPNVVLLDLGDTIQGAPLEGVYQHFVHFGKMPLGLPAPEGLVGDPMMRAMNYLNYDAMVLGNHEFNFGSKNLELARKDAHFPILSANTQVAPSIGKPFDAYLLKVVGGIKVAIVGITTPAVPMWEEAANIRGYRFAGGVEAARAAVEDVRKKYQPDIVIVGGHAGLGRDLKSAEADPTEAHGENMMYDVAHDVAGIDAVVFGHTHQQLASGHVGNVLLMQPKNWGISVGRMDFTLDDSSGAWRIVEKTSRLLPVTAETPSNPDLVKLAEPYFQAAETYLKSPVATAPATLSAQFARVRDTAIIDAIQQVQLHYAHADVSFASAFNPRSKIPRGPVTVRELSALYIYDNTLYAIEGTGKMVRDALENAARYYFTCVGDCSGERLVNSKIPGFNFDIAQGVEYELDLSQPEGQRVRNLRYKGKPLADDQKLRIAVNNYRAAGSGGYTMFQQAPVVWRSNDEVRDMMVEYYTERKTLPSEPDNNWKIVPAAALAALTHDASADRGNANQ